MCMLWGVPEKSMHVHNSPAELKPVRPELAAVVLIQCRPRLPVLGELDPGKAGPTCLAGIRVGCLQIWEHLDLMVSSVRYAYKCPVGSHLTHFPLSSRHSG
jgi:hypothetical protein